jgi:hypothetical protein
MKYIAIALLALAACAPAPTELPEDFDSSFTF